MVAARPPRARETLPPIHRRRREKGFGPHKSVCLLDGGSSSPGWQFGCEEEAQQPSRRRRRRAAAVRAAPPAGDCTPLRVAGGWTEGAAAAARASRARAGEKPVVSGRDFLSGPKPPPPPQTEHFCADTNAHSRTENDRANIGHHLCVFVLIVRQRSGRAPTTTTTSLTPPPPTHNHLARRRPPPQPLQTTTTSLASTQQTATNWKSVETRKAIVVIITNR